MSNSESSVKLIFHRLPIRLLKLESFSIYTVDVNRLQQIAENSCGHPSMIIISKYEHQDDLKDSSISKYAKRIYLLNKNGFQVQLEPSIASKTILVNNEDELETQVRNAFIAACRDDMLRYIRHDRGLVNRAAKDAENGV